MDIDINNLVGSRRGFKASNTRARNRALNIIEALQDTDDPTHAEQLIEDWKSKLDKYTQADELVQSHPDYDQGHADGDVDKAESEFFEAKPEVVGHRR